jgi:hypothetical protein
MPGFDQTGPLGEGPMTGGGFGRCVAGDVPADVQRRGLGRGGAPFGGGRGRGRGFGRGLRRRPFLRDAGAAEVAPTEAGSLRAEVQSLAAEVVALRAALAALKDTDQRLENNASE